MVLGAVFMRYHWCIISFDEKAGLTTIQSSSGVSLALNFVRKASAADAINAADRQAVTGEVGGTENSGVYCGPENRHM